MLQGPTFIPIHLPYSSISEDLRRKKLWVDAGIGNIGSKETVTSSSSSLGGSSFKFGAAVAGISKGGQSEEASYHARGDGKFQDGSNVQRQ